MIMLCNVKLLHVLLSTFVGDQLTFIVDSSCRVSLNIYLQTTVVRLQFVIICRLFHVLTLSIHPFLHLLYVLFVFKTNITQFIWFCEFIYPLYFVAPCAFLDVILCHTFLCRHLFQDFFQDTHVSHKKYNPLYVI